MQKLNVELTRLYAAAPEGETRVIALAFHKLADDGEEGHWQRLCAVANALQTDLGLPAPAVSISGANAYGLWLSLETAVPMAQAQEFARLLGADADVALVDDPLAMLPPCLNSASGKWSAFIHPGMGASFAGDEGLDIQPPEAGQVSLLEGLQSISAGQFAQALDQLRQSARSAQQPSSAAAATQPGVAPAGLLLKDATLEDIVAYLHSKNIEPTFRFLAPTSPTHHR